jgi:hypothetical protein
MKFPLQKKEIYREKKEETKIIPSTQLPDNLISTTSKDSTTLLPKDTVSTIARDSFEILKKDTIAIAKSTIDSLKKDTLSEASRINFCVNFIIDSIWIIKQKSTSAILGFSIQNIGNQSIRLWGETPEAEDNLAIKAFLSSFDHYTNSSYFLRGLYIQDEANAIGGILEPMQRVTAQMNVSLKNKTKFTPYIVLEINALHSIEECNGSDNFKAIRLN